MSATAAARLPDADLRRESAKTLKNLAVVDIQHGRKSSEKTSRSRQNSLRKTKNSTDLLRSRSMQRQKASKEIGIDVKPKVREGKGGQFTVANVGNNGMIFLRPVQKSAQPKTTQLPSFTFADPSPVSVITADSRELPKAARDSIWTNTSTAVRPVAGKGAIRPGLARPGLARPGLARQQRSFSQSTIDTRITNEKLDCGTFKIVIDRSEDAKHGTEQEGDFPGIRVSIPHYRLGTPRFSARGTAFLHQSLYTRSSINGEHAEGDASSLFSGEFPRPPGLEAQAVLSRRHSHASPQPYSIQTAHGPSLYTTIGPHAYTVPQSNGPISSHIFDNLSQDPHNPAMVKYSPINGEILAATPARIVAQITSENFLDYELLSDFFLTVRSYLTTHDLLSYLLARFEWAINRFDDNGRVIRVRAFAALRHWILNYFSYDFVVDRDLRVQFCDRLNALTRIVKARADYGASDMKLIADLKKCWNGRCALFWDNLQYNADGQQDLEILPGGIVGSRDSQLVNQSQLRFTPVASAPQLSINPAQLTAGTPSLANWYTAVMEHTNNQVKGHNRQVSTATSRSLPISPTSEFSMPIVSCSIPARSFRRALPYANRTLGIHPISTDAQGRRACPPAASAYAPEQGNNVAAHRRSGSFSDAARDRRAPLSSEMPEALEPVQANVYQDVSLLRGQGIVPAEPWVRPIAMTPAVEMSAPPRTSGSSKEKDSEPPRKLSAPQNPAVKSFIGNIRRALSSKQGTSPGGSGSGTAGTSGPSAPTLAVGKSAQVPLNVLYQASSTGALEPFKPTTRIDLLANKVFETYKEAVEQPAEQAMNLPDNIGVALGNESQQPSPFGAEPHRPSYGFNDRLQPPELRRLQSAMTDSSQSILIVDDTGAPNYSILPTANPAMALINAVPEQVPIKVEAHEISPVSNYTPDHSAQGVRHDEHVSPTSPTPGLGNNHDRQRELHNAFDAVPQYATPRPPLNRYPSGGRTTKTSSISLRRYASYQSTFGKHGHGMSIDTTLSRKSQRASSVRKVPARALRRRPGGDLRANKNVHDLEEQIRPRSAGSITTYSESVRNSDVLGFGEKIARTFTMHRSSNRAEPHEATGNGPLHSRHSMIRTHSSLPEKRRPSFEAAVAEFARIPDDEEGGIEVTLLKLEGKYKSPVSSPVPPSMRETARPSNPEPPSSTEPEFSDRVDLPGVDGGHSHGSGHKSADHEEPVTTELPSDDNLAERSEDDNGDEDREAVVSTMYAESEDSYNSVPLLERGADARDDASANGDTAPTSEPISPQSAGSQAMSQQQSINLRRLRYGSNAPTATTDSFLLDEEDDFLSDMSSEISDGTIEPISHDVPPPDIPRDVPNLVTLGQHHPPSPPMTMENAMQISTQADQAHEQRKPPTPDPSPVSQPAVPQTVQAQTKTDPNTPQHLPFILGYETDAIVQQFTLLEKDALREVDWRDLVDMRWQTSATTTTNWCEFLLTQDPLGVDLVTARFNIMVKWAMSEIVLTENIEERALTIMKYIHIAQQARMMHNYATLLQMTVALTSADCTRLGKTWNMVPEAEKEILQDLEMLVSPKKNFHNLRSEMEKANADQGCIPVVALYLHDLTYNAQKPSRIPAAAGDGEALINFERYRSTAVIVKSLLRLIDASSKYDFQPAEGLIDRCLWMAALPDEIISYKSKQLEWATS